MDNNFTTYVGKFPCKKCGIEVKSLRYWAKDGSVTWMCLEKHLSKVNLVPPKKKKSDFKNE